VLGQGPVGLLTTQLYVNRKVNVIATEVSEKRMDFGKKYGATVYDARERDYVSKILRDVGMVDGVIETAATHQTLLDAIELVRPGGRIAVFGAQNELVLPYRDLRIKGVEMRFPQATFDSQREALYWEEALRLMREGEVDVKGLITHRMSLWDLPEIFAKYDRENWVKVILEP